MSTEMQRLLCRPAWHLDAACAREGARNWTITSADGSDKLGRLRSTCATCPVRGRCLAEALAESTANRGAGPVRVGVTGTPPWQAVRCFVGSLVEDTSELSDAEWTILADGIVAGEHRAHMAT